MDDWRDVRSLAKSVRSARVAMNEPIVQSLS